MRSLCDFESCVMGLVEKEMGLSWLVAVHFVEGGREKDMLGSH